MKKACKIAGIFATGILSVVNLLKLIPEETLVGTFISGLFAFLKTINWLSILVSAVLSVLGLFAVYAMIESLKEESRTYTFDTGKKKFYSFFSSWYSQPGVLSIICDDIDWTVTEDNDIIFRALKKKSKANQLNLLIDPRVIDSELVKELKDEGANVVGVSHNIITNYSFSCISIMVNNSTVIVRDKQKDRGGIIKFKEVSSNYVTGLLNALIEEEAKSEKKITEVS